MPREARSIMSACFPRRPARPLLACLLVALLAPMLLTGCGHSHHSHEGYILVDNRSDLTTNEYLLAFRVAPFGHPFTGNLLPADLAPAATANLGAWAEDYYDAEGDFELGDLIEWFDIWVGDQQTTVFEAL